MVKNLPDHAGVVRDMGLIPGLERSPGVGNGNPAQYSCLENPMDRGASWAAVCGVAESCTTEPMWGSGKHVTYIISGNQQKWFSVCGMQLSILKHRLKTEMVLGLTSPSVTY